MRLIEHHGMRNARLRAAPEHVLVQPVEHEGRERLLQVVVLRRVDAYDRRLAAFPQVFVRFGQLKKTIVGQFIEPSEERTQASVRPWVTSQNIEKPCEWWLNKGANVGSWVAPALLNEAVLDRTPDPFSLDGAQFWIDGNEDVA